jgi:hypothetical protein
MLFGAEIKRRKNNPRLIKVLPVIPFGLADYRR